MHCFADAEQRSARKVSLFPQNLVWWLRVTEKITTEILIIWEMEMTFNQRVTQKYFNIKVFLNILDASFNLWTQKDVRRPSFTVY